MNNLINTEIKVETKNEIKFINFEEVKENLASRIKIYENLQVEFENLKECKTVGIKLRKLKKAIDEKRKEIKKEFSSTFNQFDGDCKKLSLMVTMVEERIMEGIKVFDDAEIDEKRKEIKKVMLTLDKEYNFELTDYDSKYLNKTYTLKQIQEDLKSVYDEEKMTLETESIKRKMFNEMFEKMNRESKAQMKQSFFESKINFRRHSIDEIENLLKDVFGGFKEPTPTPTATATATTATTATTSEKIYKVSLEVTCTKPESIKLKNFLILNNIKYEGKIEVIK